MGGRNTRNGSKDANSLGGPDAPIDGAEYRRVFAALVQERADAILVNEEVENITNRNLIVELADENRLPAI